MTSNDTSIKHKVTGDIHGVETRGRDSYVP